MFYLYEKIKYFRNFSINFIRDALIYHTQLWKNNLILTDSLYNLLIVKVSREENKSRYNYNNIYSNISSKFVGDYLKAE